MSDSVDFKRESDGELVEDVGEAFVKAEEEEREAAKREHDEIDPSVSKTSEQPANTEDDNRPDEGEEEEEDDDDEEEEEDAPRRKRRRAANQFIDIEAEVDDEEEDELDEDDEEAELIRQQFIADDKADEEGGRRDDRLHREYDLRRQEAEDQDAEELAQSLKEKYRRSHTVYRGDLATSGAVSQKLLMPSINDPAIYGIRCKQGAEKDLVRKLFDKKRTFEKRGQPLDILLVFQRDAFRGYIYIEAKRPDAIDKALNGMINVYARDKLLVPVKEYPELLKQIKSSDVEIVPGIYVRITRGNYKGDLAIVDNLSENGLEVRCKLVPRLDYGRNDEYDRDGRKIIKRGGVRPMPRLFNEQEARQYDPGNLQPGRTRGGFFYKGEEYNGGFLFKDFKLQFIQTKDVHPSLEELDRFQQGKDEDGGLDLAAIAALVKLSGGTDGLPFQPGDRVEIKRGELARTVGQVVEAALSEVVINVTNSGDPNFVNQRITVPAGDLRKMFNEGDHVRVITGKHAEETGLVIKVEGENVVLVSDLTKNDIKVFANYLVKATDASTVIHDFGQEYDIKDLVQLNASTAGVIVKAERGIFEVLTTDNRTISVKPSGIASKLKLTRREQVATDRNGSKIAVGDTVKDAIAEKHDKREGTIIHVYKLTVFVQLKEITENLGIYATNCINVSTVFTKDLMTTKSRGPDLSQMNPNLNLPQPMAPPSFRARGPGGRDKLIQKDVTVTQGNYKGLMGKVVDTTDTIATIELHTKAKRIKVDKNKLNVIFKGQAIPYLRFIGAPMAAGGEGAGSRAYALGGRLAWNGGATPAQGAGSLWGSGSNTLWGGSKTPAYSSGDRLTWGGGSGGALSWGSLGNTSTWGASSGNQLTWGGGSTWGGSGGGAGGNGGESTWGGNLKKSGSGSSWGGGGGNSTWGLNSGGNLTWGQKKQGGNLTWGSGGNLTWGSLGSGGNSSWGS